MKHLKKFNESSEEITKLSNRLYKLINKPIFSPPTDKVLINQIYAYVIVELTNSKWISIDTNRSVEIWDSRQDAIENMEDETTGYDQHFEFSDFTNIIDYNDINFQEIENILMELDLGVNDIWVIKQ